MNETTYLVKYGYNSFWSYLLQNFFLLRRFSLARPSTIRICYTFRCNLKCRQCTSYTRPVNELSTDKWKFIIVELRKWLGNFCIRISGGEPFMREDLLEMIRFSYNLGILTFLTTNGTLIDERMAEDVSNSGLDLICISLDGSRAETNDFLRGLPGAYNKTVRAIGFLKDRLKMMINTVISEQNMDEIMDLIDFAAKNNSKLSLQGLVLQNEYKKASLVDFSNNDLWPKDPKKVDRFFKDLILRKKKERSSITNSLRHLELLKFYYLNPEKYLRQSPCLAYHQNNLRILPDGSVKFCSGFGSIGNIASEDPDRLWRSKQSNLIRNEIRICRRDCHSKLCYYYETFPEKVSKFLLFLK